MGTLIGENIVKTRKDHKCFGCRKPIPKKSVAYTQTYAEDGKIKTTYMCLDCFGYCNFNKCNECHEQENAFEGFVKECKLMKGEKV